MMKNTWLVLLLVPLFFVSCRYEKKEAAGGKTPQDSTKAIMAELNSRIEENPKDADLYNKRATLYLKDLDFSKALNDIKKATEIAPTYPVYYITLSDIYLMQGQSKNCSEALLKALSLDPKNNDVLLKLAKLNLIIKEYPTAFEYVKKALSMDPVNPRAYFIRGIALLEKGDTVRAVEDLKKAVDQDQEFYDAYLELGELYSIKHDKLAADYLRNALNIKPQSKEALYLLGMYYQENNQYEKAIDTYAILGKIDTSLRTVPYNTGYICLVYLKDFRKAEFWFSKAIAKDPGYAEAYYNRGCAWEQLGDFEKAYADYKMTLKLKTNYELAIEGLNRLDNLRLRKKH